MKQIVFRYGMYGLLAITVLTAFHLYVVLPNTSFESSEIAGYLTMLVSMIFVFVGIKKYRDQVNNGSLTFGQGMKIGALIVLIPAVAFGLFDVLYTEVLNPGWTQQYYEHYVQQVKASALPGEIDKKLKGLEESKKMFDNPVFAFLIMAGTVYVIGIIVTIISSLSLMRKKKTIIA